MIVYSLKSIAPPIFKTMSFSWFLQVIKIWLMNFLRNFAVTASIVSRRCRIDELQVVLPHLIIRAHLWTHFTSDLIFSWCRQHSVCIEVVMDRYVPKIRNLLTLCMCGDAMAWNIIENYYQFQPTLFTWPV